MGFPLLMVVRDEYRGGSNWGDMYVISIDGKEWQNLCYSYELPWIEDKKGRSKNWKSRIKPGTYEMEPRDDGDKGWRLELKGTGHRKHIQVHRAHKSMYIKGCILPVTFRGFEDGDAQKGDKKIQTDSIALMQRIRAFYEARHTLTMLDSVINKNESAGRPTITIAAKLPVRLDPQFTYA